MLTALAALLATAAAQEVGCMDLYSFFTPLPELKNLAAFKTAYCGSSCAELIAGANVPAAYLEQWNCVCSSPAITVDDSMVGCELSPPPPPTPLSPPPLPPTAPPPAICEGFLDATPFESAAWKTVFCGSDCDSLRAVAEEYMTAPYRPPGRALRPGGALWVEQMQCQCANPDVPWMETVVCYPARLGPLERARLQPQVDAPGLGPEAGSLLSCGRWRPGCRLRRLHRHRGRRRAARAERQRRPTEPHLRAPGCRRLHSKRRAAAECANAPARPVWTLTRPSPIGACAYSPARNVCLL